MQISKRSMVRQNVACVRIFCVLAIFLTFGITESFADTLTSFHSTSDYSYWQVATNVGGTDGLFSSFPAAGFVGATAITISGRNGWIANNSTGTNGWIGLWTFFVFRQTFDLTGYNPTTADLQFQWAADDSGQGFADRGTWIPKYRLNGGSLIAGSWPGGSSYSLGSPENLSSGFVSGLNTLDFYVEGNGVTDGFALSTVSFTADPANQVNPVPEPSTMMLLGSGLVGLVGYGRRRFKK